MKSISAGIMILCATVFFFGIVKADMPYIPVYTKITVTPAAPHYTTDSLALQVNLGTTSSPCSEPTYTNKKFTITQQKIAGIVVSYTISVTYTTLLPPGAVCQIMVYPPVNYGPTFDLGKLSAGTYTVVDGADTDGTFSVSVKPSPITISGMVFNDPSPLKIASMPIAGAKLYLETVVFYYPLANQLISPAQINDSATTDNSGKFQFVNVLQGNYTLVCSRAGYNSITEGLVIDHDTTITIAMLDTSAAASIHGKVVWGSAPVAGCTVTVQSALIATPYMLNSIAQPTQIISPAPNSAITGTDGTFHISGISLTENNSQWTIILSKSGFATRESTIVLSNMDNKEINLQISPVKTNINPSTFGGASAQSSVLYNGRMQTLLINVPSQQRISVNLFSLDGKLSHAASINRELPQGMNSISLKNEHLGNGVYLVKIQSKDLCRAFTVNVGR